MKITEEKEYEIVFSQEREETKVINLSLFFSYFFPLIMQKIMFINTERIIGTITSRGCFQSPQSTRDCLLRPEIFRFRRTNGTCEERHGKITRITQLVISILTCNFSLCPYSCLALARCKFTPLTSTKRE